MQNDNAPAAFGSSFPVGPGAVSDTPIVINDVPRGGRKKKLVVIGAIIVLLAAAITTVVLLTSSGRLSGGLEKEKAVAALKDISKNSSDLEYLLDKVYSNKVNINETKSGDITGVLAMYDSVKKQYGIVGGESKVVGANSALNEQFDKSVTKTKEWLDAYSGDMQVLADFNDGFIKKLTDVRDVPIPEDKLNSDKLMVWEHNEQAKKLLSSSNGNVKAAAEQLNAYIDFRVAIIAEYNKSGCEDADTVSQFCANIRISLSSERGANNMSGDILKGIVSSFRGEYSDKQSSVRDLSNLANSVSVELEEGKK
jgi:hypothetical protein